MAITNKQIIERLDQLEKRMPNGEVKELCREVKRLQVSQTAHTKKQEEQFSETHKHIRSLEKRLYNPDDGVIAKVNSLTVWKSSVTKALWILFSGVVGLTIATIKSLGGF